MLMFQLGYAQRVIYKVAQNPIAKFLLGILSTLFNIKPELLFAVVIAMFLDGFFGVWHSIKKGEKIKQSVIASTVTKAIVYTGGISVSVAVSNAGIGFFSLLDDMVIAAILFTEVVSLFAHLAYIHSDWGRVTKFAQFLMRKGHVPTAEEAQEYLDSIDKKKVEEGDAKPDTDPPA